MDPVLMMTSASSSILLPSTCKVANKAQPIWGTELACRG